MKYLVFTLFLTSTLFAQTTTPEQSQIELFDKRLSDMEQIAQENSEMLKRQLKDQYHDQSSRGFIEIKVGRSIFEPKDIEDINDEAFNDMNSARWEKFDYANIIDFEIGKAILNEGYGRHEFGIGYQHFRSKKVQASFTDTSSGKKIKVTETILAHTLFARYAYLFNLGSSDKFLFGPGMTLGYSPVTKILLEAESGNEGAQIYGENTSMLVEIFGKAKYEFTRYLYLVGTAGYRIQKADNIRLNAAELVTVKTKTDLDLSGFYATAGFATSF